VPAIAEASGCAERCFEPDSGRNERFEIREVLGLLNRRREIGDVRLRRLDDCGEREAEKGREAVSFRLSPPEWNG
jgi:hypothetical protein